MSFNIDKSFFNQPLAQALEQYAQTHQIKGESPAEKVKSAAGQILSSLTNQPPENSSQVCRVLGKLATCKQISEDQRIAAQNRISSIVQEALHISNDEMMQITSDIGTKARILLILQHLIPKDHFKEPSKDWIDVAISLSDNLSQVSDELITWLENKIESSDSENIFHMLEDFSAQDYKNTIISEFTYYDEYFRTSPEHAPICCEYIFENLNFSGLDPKERKISFEKSVDQVAFLNLKGRFIKNLDEQHPLIILAKKHTLKFGRSKGYQSLEKIYPEILTNKKLMNDLLQRVDFKKDNSPKYNFLDLVKLIIKDNPELLKNFEEKLSESKNRESLLEMDIGEVREIFGSESKTIQILWEESEIYSVARNDAKDLSSIIGQEVVPDLVFRRLSSPEDVPYKIVSWFIEESAQYRLKDETVKETKVGEVSGKSLVRPKTIVSEDLQRNSTLYGNKASNLMEIRTLLEEVEGVDVPDFLPLGHNAIFEHLTANSKFTELWLQFKTAQANEKNHLTEESKKILKKIRGEIVRAFEEGFNPEGLEHWLKKFKDYLLMVRSTGKEDSSEVANAGGNESVAAVKPTNSAVSQAIAQVISSYFSEKSLEQRLVAGDEIVGEPFMPVLLQVMVGEKIGGEKAAQNIVTSGVGFFREAEGKTEGVLHIQSAPGHGELVVNSLAPVDSFYVGTSGIIRHDIRKKDQRLVPSEKGNQPFLELQDNPSDLQKSSSLSDEQIAKMRKVAAKLKEHYQHDVDFEFVSNRNTGEINIVQVRPIVHNVGAQPEYVSNLNEISKEMTVSGKSIGVAGGAIRTIEDPGQLIICDTLPQALEKFLRMSEKHQVQSVVVRNWAPATSHEASTFRSQGIPVLCVDDLEKIQSMKDQGNLPIVISPQQGVIVNIGKLETLKRAPGWVTHPIPKQMTVGTPDVDEGQLKSALEKLGNINDVYPTHTLNLLLEMIGGENKEKAYKALRTIVRRFGAFMKSDVVKSNPDFEETLLKLYKHIGLGLIEIVDAYERDGDRMSILYARNRLETVLYQLPLEGSIDSESVKAVLGNLKEELEIAKRLEGKSLKPEHHAYVVQLLKLKKTALTHKTAEKWEQFVIALAQGKGSSVRLNVFARQVKVLSDYGLLTAWINTDFSHAWTGIDSETDLTKKARGFLKENIKKLDQNQEVLSWIKGKQVLLNRWKNQTDQFADPAKFERLTMKLHEEFEAEFSEKIFTRKMSSLGKAAFMNFLIELTETMDGNIKALHGSPLYNENDSVLKARNMAILLDDYTSLMNRVVLLVDPLGKKKLAGDTVSFDSKLAIMMKLFEEVKGRLHTLSENKAAEELLLPGKHFSVAAAHIGVHEKDVKRTPESLEDIFTLTHQNILQMIATVGLAEGIKTSELPPVLQKWNENIKGIPSIARGEDKTNRLVSIKYDYPKIVTRHNIPLRDHSIIIESEYDVVTKELNITPFFIGVNDNPHDPIDRMNTVAATAILVSLGSDVPFTKGHKPVYSEEKKLLNFTWNLDKKRTSESNKTLSDLRRYITMMIALTMPSEVTDVDGFSPSGEKGDNYCFSHLCLKPQHVKKANPDASLRLLDVLNNLNQISGLTFNGLGMEHALMYPVLAPHIINTLVDSGQAKKALKLCVKLLLESDTDPSITPAVKLFIIGKMTTEWFKIIKEGLLAKRREIDLLKICKILISQGTKPLPQLPSSMVWREDDFRPNTLPEDVPKQALRILTDYLINGKNGTLKQKAAQFLHDALI